MILKSFKLSDLKELFQRQRIKFWQGKDFKQVARIKWNNHLSCQALNKSNNQRSRIPTRPLSTSLRWQAFLQKALFQQIKQVIWLDRESHYQAVQVRSARSRQQAKASSNQLSRV